MFLQQFYGCGSRRGLTVRATLVAVLAVGLLALFGVSGPTRAVPPPGFRPAAGRAGTTPAGEGDSRPSTPAVATETSSVRATAGTAPIVGTATTPSANGYWLVGSDGGVFAFGNAGYFGSLGGLVLRSPIVGIASTPTGDGYWLVAADGGVFAFGDAHFYGSLGGIALDKPIVGIASTDAGGYWLVASDGGVFTFGDAQFYGSLGGIALDKPIVGIASTGAGGYWLVASDGGVFAFGNAEFQGSLGGVALDKPITAIAAPDPGGYWLMAADGGVFTFGDARFFGSSATASQGSYVSIAADGDKGYRLANGEGTSTNYGNLPTLQLGVNVASFSAARQAYTTEFTLDRAMGATWVRQTVTWSSLQPTDGSSYSPVYLSYIDERIAAAADVGLKTLVVLLGTPAWARPAGSTIATPPSDPASYGVAVAYLAARYPATEVAFEIWNEPDISTFFTGSPLTYTEMACDAYQDVKAVSVATTVVVGAIAGIDKTFLKAIYNDGIHGCFDALSFHPYIAAPGIGSLFYNWDPAEDTTLAQSIQAARALMVAEGDGSKAIWFTEFGWPAPVTGPTTAPTVTLQQQAAYTVSFLEYCQTLPFVPVTMIYESSDDTSPGAEGSYGLMTALLVPKPAYTAVQELFGQA